MIEGDRKREHYRRRDVARAYEARRFGGPGGRYVDERERRAVAELLEGLSGRILDLPTGTGRLLPMLETFASRVFGADGSLAMLCEGRSAGRAFPTAAADALRTPFRSAAFDIVVVLRFFFHAADPAALLSEVARLVRPGGYLVFDTLLSSPRAKLPRLQRIFGGRVYASSPEEVEALLQSSGFAVKRTISIFALPSQGYRFLPGFLLPLVRRLDEAVADSRRTKRLYLAWKRPFSG